MREDHWEDQSYVGTREYRAPETLVNLSFNRHFSSKIDVWSFGVIAFELIFFKCPFTSSSSEEYVSNVMNSPR